MSKTNFKPAFKRTIPGAIISGLIAAWAFSLPAAAAPEDHGRFPAHFVNQTHGKWSDNEIYITIIGQAEPGIWSYLTPSGTVTPIDHKQENAAGHLVKRGRNFANMSFAISQASTVSLPSHLEGARIYISLGSPMYLGITPDDSGWAGPNLNDRQDPNDDVIFDWYEYTYHYGFIPFGGNTTQVDMFGFPLIARLEQSSSGFDQTRGIWGSRDDLFRQFQSQAGGAFTQSAGAERIVSPRSSPAFAADGSGAAYLNPAIDEAWNYYSTHPFHFNRPGDDFRGQVKDGELRFSHNGASGFALKKPTTRDVMACSGALASKGMATEELALGAELCAAFNRGVAGDTSAWHDASAYYRNPLVNDYAKFLHTAGLDKRAYAFAYDDVNDQSSVSILPDAAAPSGLTLTVGW